MNKIYDVIIIGAGHNGLVCAAYLAKAGLSVLVIERRHETGGGLTTEDFAGARFNLHATYHLMSDIMPPYLDFNLKDEGVVYITPEVQVAQILPDGKAIILYRDLDKTVEELKKISPSDAEKYKEMYLEFKKLCDEIIIPMTYVLPIPPIEQMILLQKNELGRKLAELSELSPIEIIDKYKFENKNLRALLLFLSTVWGLQPQVGGLGYLVPLYIYRMTNVSLVKGGSHRLSSALCKIILRNKGDILDGREVKKIIIKEGKAGGVVVDDGEEYYGKIIVSNLNPPQTFLDLIGGENLPKEISLSAKNWRWEKRTFFGLHLVFKEKILYKSLSNEVNNALLTVIGYDTEDILIKHIKEIEEGILPEEICGHITSTTVFDKSQAPENLHILRWENFAPHKVGGEVNWDKIKDNYANRCIEKIREYTNINKPITIYPYTPLDIERKITCMREGSVKHGEYNPLQMGYFRPNDLCSTTKTPIEGLYLCGASCYPGGMITAGPGYNCANMICEEIKEKKWWQVPLYVQKAKELKIILP